MMVEPKESNGRRRGGQVEFSILVADDDSDSRDALAEALKRRGYRVVEARDGEEALHRIEKGNVHLNVLDYHMPGLDGLEILQHLRRLHRELPSILMTAQPSEELRQRAFELGATDFRVKPLDIFDLRTRIAEMLGQFFQFHREMSVRVKREALQRRAEELRRMADHLDAEVNRMEEEFGFAPKDE